MSDSKRIDMMIGRLKNCQRANLEHKDTISEDIKEELKELGVVFGCSGYGDSYCLSLRGAIAVLEATKRLK